MGRKKASAPSKTLQLPGFGLPINKIPDNVPVFPTALYGKPSQRERITIREYEMMLFMNRLTDKPEWDRKIYDDTICAKWRDEALSLETLSEKCIDWCLKELKHEANLFKETGIIRALDGGIFKADSIIPHDVKEALKKAILPLEDVPERLRDWHPGSDGKVLDLVHPSLFPLVYGRSRILPEGKVGLDDCIQRTGEGVTIIDPSQKNISTRSRTKKVEIEPPEQNAWSNNFQWLPCDVRFEKDENRVKIESYINNLHPQIHRELYSVIEDILSRAIPLFNQTLTLLHSPELHRPRISCEGINYPDGFGEEDYPGEEDGEDEDEAREAWMDAREPIQPEPEEDYTPAVISESDRMDLRREFSGSGLQVIVKLASIHLTPDKPEYEGGSWHVEGQGNEHICATGLYYYDSENITENTLAFRCQVNEDLMDFSYEQNDDGGFYKLFGVSGSFSPAVQDLGDVITKEDRLITFPNIFQHQVTPFSLADPSKPGHRKILAFFLVDPHIRVISTANVPCQRKDWWANEIGYLPKLPRETFDHVIDGVDEFPLSMEDAKVLRERLMDERRVYIHNQTEQFNQVQFGLCEH